MFLGRIMAGKEGLYFPSLGNVVSKGEKRIHEAAGNAFNIT